MKIAFFLVVALPTISLSAEPADLARLRDNYLQAAERALTPVKLTYEKELQKLLDTYTKAGKLDDALQVKNEMTKLKGGVIAAPVSSPETDKLRGYFVGRTWVTGSGSAFSFKKDGSGEVQWDEGKEPFTWEVTDPKTVMVQRPGKRAYFFFESRQKGEMADSLDGTRRKLEPK
jgi:pentatricopeptide repeat protein